MKRALSLFLSIIMIFSLFSCLSVLTSAAGAVLESVSFTPKSELKAYEYTMGYWDIQYDEETGGQVNKFYYNGLFNQYEEGNVITLTYSNGKSVEYVCKDWFYSDKKGNELNEDSLSFDYNQNENPWVAGTNNIIMTYEGLAAEIPVEIMETPLESVQFVPASPIKLMENADGDVFKHELGPDVGTDYFAYQLKDKTFDAAGNKFVLNYKTGEVVTFTSDGKKYTDENGEEINFNYFTDYDVQDISPWTEVGAHAFPFYFMGCKSEIPVTVIESPVASIQYFSAGTYSVIENYDGWVLSCDCQNCAANNNEYFKYDLTKAGFPCKNDKLVVTYKDGTVKEYVNNGNKFKDSNGKNLPYNISYEDFQEETHWLKGTQYITVTYLGQTVMVPVQVVENPIADIRVTSATPLKIYEFTRGFWDTYYDENNKEVPCYFYYENLLYEGNISLAIDYTDGRTETYSYNKEKDCFCGEDGKELDGFTWYSDQFEKPWGLGNHAVTVEYMGKTFEIPVTIIKNPVKSIDFIPAKSLVFKYEVDGEWDEPFDSVEDEYGKMFLYDIEKYSPYTNGNKLVVTYTSGKTETFTYSKKDKAFLNKKGKTLVSGYDVIYHDTQIGKPWTLTSESNTITVEYMGRFDEVRVVLDNGVAPKMAKISSCQNGAGAITINWNHIPNASKYEIYRKDETAKGVSDWKKIGTTTDNVFVDKGVKSSKFYRYIVHAVNSGGRSAFDKSMVVRTKYIAPLKTFKIYNAELGIRIDCGSTDGYNKIYRRAKGETKWTYMGKAPGNEKFICDGTVKNGVSYTYYAVRVDGKYKSARVYSDTLKYVTTPDVKTIKNTLDGIKITWSKVENCDGYRVYRKAKGEKKFTYLTTTKKLVYLDDSIAKKSGKTYQYRVRAISDNVLSGYEDISLTRYVAPKVTKVSNVTNGINIKWDKVSKATEYKVYRQGAKDSKWTVVGTTKNTSFTDTSVKNSNGKVYKYTVRAVYNGNLSPYDTNGVSIKRLSTPVLKGVANDQNKIKIKFDAVKGAEGYYVYRKTAKTKWVRVGTTTKTLYKDATVKEGTVYFYTVKAYSGDYVSGYDTTGRKIRSVWAPGMNSLVNTKNGVQITWHSQKVADEYHIYKKTGNGEWEVLGVIRKSDLKKNKYGEFTYTDKNVKNNTVYAYTVRAYTGGYFSSYYTDRYITYYDPIDVISAKAGKKGITIKWEKAEGAKSYLVLRKEKGEKGFSFFESTPISELSCLDKTVVSGKTYEYAVCAVGGPKNKQGNSVPGGTKICIAK